MATKAKKIVSLEKKIQLLQEEKKKTEMALDNERLKNLKNLGLFELSDSEMYGFVIEGLKNSETNRCVWKTQGERFLQTGKSKPKVAETAAIPAVNINRY